MERVIGLWTFLVAWLGWYCAVLAPNTAPGRILHAAIISAFVGATLNLLNWIPLPPGFKDRAVWIFRVLGNFAVPFAVSLTAGAMG